MQCPTCQHDLVEIPTVEGPQLDVCPDRHGLWLDRGEATLFVENYGALEGMSRAVGLQDASGEAPNCPKCGGKLDEESVLSTPLMACRACDGWWLPRGSLSQLNARARGGAGHIRFDELDFYRRAEKRAWRLPTRESTTASRRHRPLIPQLWFWTVFLSLGLLLAALVLTAGMRKSGIPGVSDGRGLLLVLGTLGGTVLSTYGLLVNNRKRLIEGLPTSPIRSLAVGLVEVSGRAQPERAPLRAPFSGLPCVFYSYIVEQRRESGKEARWVTIARGTSAEPFYVQDDTGKVLVVPFGAELILAGNRTTRGNWAGTLPPETIVGLLKLGIGVDGRCAENTIRCSESFILPDERVYVMGMAEEHKGAAESGENPARLYIGRSRDNAFIISDRSEKELLSQLRWQVWASIAVGPALALVCLVLMFTTPGMGR